MKTQLKKIFIAISLLIVLVSSILYLTKYIRNDRNLRQIVSEIAQSDDFSHLIDGTDILYEQSAIKITIQLKDQFDSLKGMEQCAIFEFFHRRLRNFLLTGEYQNSFYYSAFKLVGQTSDHTYFLRTPVPDHQVIYDIKSTFYIDGIASHYTHDLVNQITNYIDEHHGDAKEIEILRYTAKVFYLLTSSGKYYNDKADKTVILDSVSKKYGITHEEFMDIFNRAYLWIGAPIFDNFNE
ncbi:MAG: hypothetical protein ACI35R_08095 [Bacillus sp. (in: firmicutes)]